MTGKQGSGGTQQAALPTSIIDELLVKARAKIQDKRRKKLEKIMDLLARKENGSTGSIGSLDETRDKSPRAGSPQVSNDEVQKLLRVSDATATRYLDLLEKEDKIRQEGKTGKYVVYVKM